MKNKKKYQIILADPPWPIGKMMLRGGGYAEVAHYKYMKLSDIQKLPVSSLVHPNGCHLFLWTTHKFLPHAFEICEQWGFTYHCLLTWDKTKGPVPLSFMWSTEFCIYAQIKNKWLRPNRIGMKALIREKSKEHSAKPRYMYSVIEEFCGELPRVELFSRTVVKGWDRWGDETISNVDFI